MEKLIKYLIYIPKKDSVISLKDSYLELHFNVSHRAGGHA